ncbi:MAG TPA: metallophosphoesterase [bacterium]|jgi:sphingomyelin phosphodiesterase acid-like 3|nr:metallophosphoesterase [bacterium]
MKNGIHQKVLVLAVLFALVVPGLGWSQNAPFGELAENQGTFLLLADIHFDPYADKELVSQLVKEPVTKWADILSSSQQTDPAAYGTDTNSALWTSCLSEVRKFNNVDYVIVNGDYLSHHFLSDFKNLVQGDNKVYLDFVDKTLLYISQSLQDALPDVPIYFCLGNNDSDCEDYEMTPESPMLPPITQFWATVAADTRAKAEFTEGGYYAVKHPTLKNQEFVVLNDVFWAVKYDNACGQAEDEPGKKEMIWLQQKLDEARKNHLKVTLIDHMPVGIHARNASEHSDSSKAPKTFWRDVFADHFTQLIRNYRDVVAGMYSGHTHFDDFRVLSDIHGNPLMFDHITPAVSPVRNNNPGFQVMEYDRKTGKIANMATYYFNLAGTSKDWSLEYTFDQTYGLQGYNAENLAALSDKISNDPAIRDKYIRFVAVSSTHEPPINSGNWKYFNCAQTHMDDQSYVACHN